MAEEKAQTMQNMQMDGKESLVSETVAGLKGIPVKDELIKDLSKETLVVTFAKLDGDERIMTCTKNLAVIPTEHHPKTSKPGKPETITVWDLNAKGWRSFRYDRIKKVEKSS